MNKHPEALHLQCYKDNCNPLRENGYLEFEKEILSKEQVKIITDSFINRSGLNLENLKTSSTQNVEKISGGQKMFKLFPLTTKKVLEYISSSTNDLKELTSKVCKPKLFIPSQNPCSKYLSDINWISLVDITKQIFEYTKPTVNQYWIGSAFLMFNGRNTDENGCQITHKDGDFERWHLNNQVIITPVYISHEEWTILSISLNHYVWNGKNGLKSFLQLLFILKTLI